MVSAGTLIFNGTIIVAILTCLVPERLDVVGWAVVAAAFVRLLSQIAVGVREQAFAGAFENVWKLSHLNRNLVARYVEALTAIGLTICIPVIARAFASREPGQMAAVTYALKLVEVPTGLCGAVLAMVVFPRLSQQLSGSDWTDAQRLITRVTKLLLLLTVPTVICFFFAAGPVVSLLFERGELGAQAVAQIADLSRIAMWAIPATVVSTRAMSVFHARRDTRFPCWVGVAMTGLQLAVSPWLAHNFGTRGTMVAVALIGWLQCLCLGGGLAVRHRLSLVSETASLAAPTPPLELTELDEAHERKIAA